MPATERDHSPGDHQRCRVADERNAIPTTPAPIAGQPCTWTIPGLQGEAYGITLFTTNAIPFNVEIPVAFTTPQPDQKTFLSFTLIGVYVGVIPVYLGLLWFPALRQLGRRWMIFLLAITAGLLVFLGLDTLAEALDQAAASARTFSRHRAGRDRRGRHLLPAGCHLEAPGRHR